MDEYWEPSAAQSEFNYGGSGNSYSGSILGFDLGVDNPLDAVLLQAENNNLWSAAQAQKQMEFQRLMMDKSMKFNSAEAQANREWQEYMSNTAHQREIVDLQKAGLNPVLSVTGGNGAPVTSGATASGVGVPSGAKGDTDESSTMAIMSWLANMLSAQTSILNTSVSAQAGMANAATMAGATSYAAQLSSAASRYAADMNFANSEAQREWQSSHPTTTTQGFWSAVDSLKNVAKSYSNSSGGSSNTPITDFGAGLAHAIGAGLDKIFRKK